jgi:hypothetical protein
VHGCRATSGIGSHYPEIGAGEPLYTKQGRRLFFSKSLPVWVAGAGIEGRVFIGGTGKKYEQHQDDVATINRLSI